MQAFSKVQEELVNPSQGTLDAIEAIYGPREDKQKVLASYQEVLDGLVKEFPEVKEHPVGLYTAAGRTEIGGNHTDHQLGCVLAASINLESIAAASPNNLDKIRVYSEGYGRLEVNLSDLNPQDDEKETTPALLRGFAAVLKEAGYDVGGFDAYIKSNVLSGSGLSSSASFESLIGSIYNDLYCGGALDPETIAKDGQKVENVFFGKPCGLMDQMACSVGSAVAIDFKDKDHPVVRKVDIDFDEAGYHLVICDTLSSHGDLSSAYASIPEEMGEIASYFDQKTLRGITEEQLLENANALRVQFSDRAFLRALHFVRDNERAQKEAEFLEKGDVDGFLKTVQESGNSSIKYLQNIATFDDPTDQKVAASLAIAQMILGAEGAVRVHGGGFAGTIQAFVPHKMLSTFVEKMDAAHGGEVCHVLSIRPVGTATFI